MQRVSSFLSNVLHKRGIRDHAYSSFVVFKSQKWLEDRLPSLKQTLHVQKVQDGTLFISCSHSIAAQECHGVFGDLEHFLTVECPFSGIEQIRIVRT